MVLSKHTISLTPFRKLGKPSPFSILSCLSNYITKKLILQKTCASKQKKRKAQKPTNEYFPTENRKPHLQNPQTYAKLSANKPLPLITPTALSGGRVSSPLPNRRKGHFLAPGA